MFNSDDMNIFCKKKRKSLKKLIHPPSLTQLTASPSSAIVNWHRRRPRQKRTPYSPFCILLMNISHTSRLFDISKNFYMLFDSGWQPKIGFFYQWPALSVSRLNTLFRLANYSGSPSNTSLQIWSESFIKIITGIYAFRYQSCERVYSVAGRNITQNEHALNVYIY